MKAVVFYESADDLAEKAPLHAGPFANALKPDIHGVGTHWIGGFMAVPVGRPLGYQEPPALHAPGEHHLRHPYRPGHHVWSDGRPGGSRLAA
jgi:hypothetical protein